MTNFATFIDTGNGKAPIAQRGKAKQKRSDLRLVGLGLVVTRDGGIPLTWHAYPGDRPDVTQFPAMIGQLRGQYQAIAAAAGCAGRQPGRRRGHDGGVRRRAELRGQLRLPGRDRPALHRVGARQRLPGPDRAARRRAQHRRPGPVRRADRLRHPPGGLRRRAPRHLDPLPGTARRPRPPGSTAPPWPKQAGSWTSWPPPWPAARPAGPGTRSKPRSPRSPASPGCAASSPGSYPASSPKTCA